MAATASAHDRESQSQLPELVRAGCAICRATSPQCALGLDSDVGFDLQRRLGARVHAESVSPVTVSALSDQVMMMRTATHAANERNELSDAL